MAEYLEAIRSVAEHVRTLGIPVKTSSRLWHYERQAEALLRHASGKERVEVANMEMFKQGMLDARQLHAVAMIAGALVESEDYRMLWSKAVSGNWRAYGGAANTPGRDSQFHLLVATQLAASGLQVTLHANVDPDVRTRVRGFDVGVSSKRIKSYGHVGRSLREACQQSSSGTTVGLVAVDATLAANPYNKFLPVPNAETGEVATKMLLDLDIGRIQGDVSSCSKHEGAVALIFFADIPWAAGEGYRGTWWRWTRVDLVEASDPRRIVALDVTNRLGRGSQ